MPSIGNLRGDAASHCARSNHGNITKICSAHLIILKNWACCQVLVIMLVLPSFR